MRLALRSIGDSRLIKEEKGKLEDMGYFKRI